MFAEHGTPTQLYMNREKEILKMENTLGQLY